MREKVGVRKREGGRGGGRERASERGRGGEREGGIELVGSTVLSRVRVRERETEGHVMC